MKLSFFTVTLFFLCFLSAYCDDVQIMMKHLDILNFPEITLYSSVSSKFKTDRIFQKKDFTVTEDDHKIDNFTMKVFNPPLNIGLVLDTSGSIKGFVDKIKEGAIQFVKNLGDSDKVLIVEFSSKVILSQKATYTRGSLISAIKGIRAHGGTKLYDGLYRALEKLEGRRRTIVLFTDGRDQRMDGDTQQFSDHNYKDVIKLAKKKKINVHCIGVGKNVDKKVLHTISARTGGKFFHTLDPSKITDLYKGIARFLTRQYIVRYKTPNIEADGKLRHVRIKEIKSGTEGVLTYTINKKNLEKIRNRQKMISEMKKNNNSEKWKTKNSKWDWKQSINTKVPGFSLNHKVPGFKIRTKVPGFHNKHGVRGVKGFTIEGRTFKHLQKIEFEYDEKGFIKSATPVMKTTKYPDHYVRGTKDFTIESKFDGVDHTTTFDGINHTTKFDGIDHTTTVEGSVETESIDYEDSNENDNIEDDDFQNMDDIPEPDIDIDMDMDD